MKNEINVHIKKLRKEARLTQEDMAKMLNMKRSTYAHIESYGSFKPEQLRIIAINFERTVDELINGDNMYTRRAVEESKKPRQQLRLQQPDLYETSNSNLTEAEILEKREELASLVANLPADKLDTFINLMKMFPSADSKAYYYNFK